MHENSRVRGVGEERGYLDKLSRFLSDLKR